MVQVSGMGHYPHKFCNIHAIHSENGPIGIGDLANLPSKVPHPPPGGDLNRGNSRSFSWF